MDSILSSHRPYSQMECTLHYRCLHKSYFVIIHLTNSGCTRKLPLHLDAFERYKCFDKTLYHTELSNQKERMKRELTIIHDNLTNCCLHNDRVFNRIPVEFIVEFVLEFLGELLVEFPVDFLMEFMIDFLV